MANTGALGSPDQQADQNSLAQPTSGGLSPLASLGASLVSSPNSTNEIAGYLLGQYAPQLSAYGTQAAVASGQAGEVGPMTQLAAGELGSNEQFTLANALLGMQGIGLQSQGLSSQMGTAAAQQGIEQSQFGVQQTQFPEQLQQAALQNANALRGLSDQGAISGTLGTQGYGRSVATQGAEYGWQQADIFRNQQLSQLAQQSEQVGYGGQQEQLANQMSQLGVAAQGQGLSATQAQAQLGFGLQQLGYQGQDSLMQYLNQVATAEGGQAQQLAGIGSQAALIGGLGSTFLSGVGGIP